MDAGFTVSVRKLTLKKIVFFENVNWAELIMNSTKIERLRILMTSQNILFKD